jgi:hypothetical protein
VDGTGLLMRARLWEITLKRKLLVLFNNISFVAMLDVSKKTISLTVPVVKCMTYKTEASSLIKKWVFIKRDKRLNVLTEVARLLEVVRLPI